jgi:hypothetical protein
MADDDSAGQPHRGAPPVRVRLPDSQSVTAALCGWHQEADGTWWCIVAITLYTAVETRGRMVAEPLPVVFTAPATSCEPVPGHSYDDVPTQRTPLRDHVIEQHYRRDTRTHLVVHRPGCRPPHRRPARQAHTLLDRAAAIACDHCRPDQ